MRDLSQTFAAIDLANASDPNELAGEPLAQMQGVAASRWLAALKPDAVPALQLAVRAHHLKRWELKRVDFPKGRQGYLRWRRENKAHQADSLASIMQTDGWSDAEIEHARTLLGRTQLRSDADTQALEDAACLVFLETQFDDMVDRTEHDPMVSIVAKTLKKMSPEAISLAGSIDLSSTSQSVLNEAVASLQS